MYKVVQYNRKTIRNLLKTRLQDAMKYRRNFEKRWRENEVTVLNALGVLGDTYHEGAVSFDDLANFIDQEREKGIGVNYAFKHYRFLHAQMSANPPSVVARPTSSDPEDRRRADSADRICRHGMKVYGLPENVDLATSKTLLYGTGWIKTEFDPMLGEITRYDEETGEIEMEGDFSNYSPSTWDVWIDPLALIYSKAEYLFERKYYRKHDFVAQWPEEADKFNPVKRSQKEGPEPYSNRTRDDLQELVMPVYHYYETGLPSNGMAGRYVCCLEDGYCLSEVSKNPNRFHKAPSKERLAHIESELERGNEPDRGPEIATLPFHILTDIDVPDTIYGKSFLEYEAPIQDILNRLDSITLDNVQAHGVVRIVLPEGAEIMDDSLTDTPYEIIKVTGNQSPHYFSTPSLMPEVSSLRNQLQAGGDDMAGVNDSMFGKQEREQSGFSMQYATNQGNMIRRRLFNKYTLFVEAIYRNYLNIVRRHWTTNHTIQVLGDEKAYQVVDLKGSDISRGFDLDVEYGRSLSLDPTSRREEIMALMPIFEKAGIDTKEILRMIKLNDLEGMYDINDMAALRQQEVFEQIIEGKGKLYVKPREMQEHDGMLKYCYRYVMTSEYRDLPPNVSLLIDRHIEDREALKAGTLGGGAPAPALPPGPQGEAGPMPEAGPVAAPAMGAGSPLPGLV